MVSFMSMTDFIDEQLKSFREAYGVMKACGVKDDLEEINQFV